MPETQNKQSNAPVVSVGQGGWWATARSINSVHQSVRQRVVGVREGYLAPKFEI